MPILNSEIRSYNIIFTGKKERLIQSLQENNLSQYIFKWFVNGFICGS